MNSLSPELAITNPTAFVEGLGVALGSSSTHGMDILQAVSRKSRERIEVTPDPTTWVSRTRRGHIFIGAQPMPESTKAQVRFLPQQFPYQRDIAYRFLHELCHHFVVHAQQTASGAALVQAAANVRQATGYEQGLSALGSLPFYQRDKRVPEDATELAAMYAWSPPYFKHFTNFLGDTAMASERQQVGLVTVANPQIIYDIVATAVLENIQN